MRTLGKIALATALLACGALVWAAGAASAAEEFEKYELESASVSLSTPQAGAHADLTTSFALTRTVKNIPYAETRDVVIHLPPGLIGNPQAMPRCTVAQLGNLPEESECPQDAQVGVTEVDVSGILSGNFVEPVYNMESPGGDIVARLGFFAVGWPAFVNIRLDPANDSLVALVEGAPSAAGLLEATTTLWGVPAEESHDNLRLTPEEAAHKELPKGGRKSSQPKIPFLSNPTECSMERQMTVSVRSYQLPDAPPPSLTVPFPQISGCGLLDFTPTTSLKPTTAQGTTGSGLEYELSLPTTGLEFPNVDYGSEMKRAEVVLPEGMTINPSEAEGLGVCSEADLSHETYNSAPNVGCPDTSKIGTVEAISPVIDRKATGALYLAKPYENPFGSLLALYMVLKIPDRGVLVKLAGKVDTDPQTGQITTVFDDAPQLPVAEFKLHFREGARAPLVTPAACGTYEAVSNLTPWASPDKIVPKGNSFQIESGPDHGACPTGGLPPFRPGLLAYPTNIAAGAFTSFYLKLTRTDSEQEITHFSIKLPPGLAAKLAGVPFCPDGAIAAAKGRTGIHGAEEELNSPSCPAASQIGTSWAGAGVGDVLAYVPGRVYLAGPYHGAPISIVSVTAAKAGPFDLGTVVVREALRVNPETGEVFVDATGSDPIPHIIAGIPVHLRDIRVYVDRPKFTLNPTGCQSTSTASTVLGSGLDFSSEADDNPITVSSRFQAADCAALGFKPKLSLRLKGGTRRSQIPALKAVLKARPGDANIARSEVILPASEILEQSNVGQPCTRVEFNEAAGNGERCPASSILGRARAVTPLLSEPLEGPVIFRSNGGERDLPDIVATLRGQEIDIHLVGWIDSVYRKSRRGEVIPRIRTRFEVVPDAPVSKFVLEMKGGKHGLLVNSESLCRGTHRAEINFTAHNGKVRDLRPLVRTSCPRHHKGKAHKRR
jgi:hypothetical protein